MNSELTPRFLDDVACPIGASLVNDYRGRGENLFISRFSNGHRNVALNLLASHYGMPSRLVIGDPAADRLAICSLLHIAELRTAQTN
jgi:hypothetical protein